MATTINEKEHTLLKEHAFKSVTDIDQGGLSSDFPRVSSSLEHEYEHDLGGGGR